MNTWIRVNSCHQQIHKSSQVCQAASLCFLSKLRELQRPISMDYQTGSINGSFFSIGSNENCQGGCVFSNECPLWCQRVIFPEESFRPPSSYKSWKWDDGVQNREAPDAKSLKTYFLYLGPAAMPRMTSAGGEPSVKSELAPDDFLKCNSFKSTCNILTTRPWRMAIKQI